ncbi:MAG: YlxR family protein [Chloroflexi bacterium]|nr:YlxR family protein [Chloroflexota bacterium]
MTQKHVKHVPLRTCVACRTKRPQIELVRLVRSPAGEFSIDPAKGASGRGLYLCRNRQCWVDGVQNGRIARATRSPVETRSAAELMAWAGNNLSSSEFSRVE